jgi:hypothetical protein
LVSLSEIGSDSNSPIRQWEKHYQTMATPLPVAADWWIADVLLCLGVLMYFHDCSAAAILGNPETRWFFADA